MLIFDVEAVETSETTAYHPSPRHGRGQAVGPRFLAVDVGNEPIPQHEESQARAEGR